MDLSRKKSKTSHAAGSTSKTEGQTSGADTPTTGDKNSSALVAAEATETDAPTSCAQPADGKPSTFDDIMSLSSAVPSPEMVASDLDELAGGTCKTGCRGCQKEALDPLIPVEI